MTAGCGDNPSSSNPSAPSDVSGGSDALSVPVADDPTDYGSYGADVQAILDAGVLKVGVKSDVIGFGYMDPLTGTYEGMEIDIASKIADLLGVSVEFTTVTAATRAELLDAGDINCVLATFTISDERKQSWDFTTPYYTDRITVLVKDESGVTDLAGLVDKTVGVSYKQYEDYPSISIALEAGEVDAFCVDLSILAAYKTAGRSYIDAEFAPQNYGIATTKGSGFSTLCEELITRWLADGTISGLIAQYGL